MNLSTRRSTPLAWLLWHVTRTEDSAVNLLIFDGPQVLDDAWCARLNTGRRDAGTGMTMDEVVDLSSHVHLPRSWRTGRLSGNEQPTWSRRCARRISTRS